MLSPADAASLCWSAAPPLLLSRSVQACSPHAPLSDTGRASQAARRGKERPLVGTGEASVTGTRQRDAGESSDGDGDSDSDA